jgi:hypothetical protein
MKWFLILLVSAPLLAQQAKETRVYVAEQAPWLDASNLVTPSATNAPSRTEQIRNLAQYCPSVIITEDQAKADLILVWESKSYQQTRWGGHEHEWTLYNPQKDLLASGATYHMKNAAKDVCKAITKANGAKS